ncbi:rhodanese-like domain-containing protein [Natronorubrum sp. DTA7]|uniref:rhodanese-like domain-containing protein n=1 Tax=Natronorubrum sp. DTA7 TaxID=3447016 RepID=UPI003F828E4E
MNRRTFLAVGGTATLGGIAGCLSGDDGSPANEFDYETQSYEGTAVPLAPIDDVIEWYENDEAEFVDARGRDQYDEVRIAGAVFSPAPDGVDDDPTEEWSTDTRIVTYCGCPHHLSVMRGATLIDAGYEHTYAIDEGLQEWYDRQYPMEGSSVDVERQSYRISGTTDPEYRGQMALLEQLDADRAEAAPIDDDGSYTLQLHYAGSPDSEFRVGVDGNWIEGTLAELTSGPVTI